MKLATALNNNPRSEKSSVTPLMKEHCIRMTFDFSNSKCRGRGGRETIARLKTNLPFGKAAKRSG